MYTYEVWVRSQKYYGRNPLSYTAVDKLAPGTLVRVSLRQEAVVGIVRRQADAPKSVAMKPIETILCSGAILPKEILELLDWMLRFYPSGSGAITQLFIPSRVPVSFNKLENATIKNIFTGVSLPKLTRQQSSALKIIRKGTGSYLLHGVTGSGKTRLYVELIIDTIKANKSVLLLVPEIGLTPQITETITSIINPKLVTVIHSSLTPASRQKAWLSLLTSRHPQIVIGPRSALFSPLTNIGLVIIDECHDDSYKQESSPYYHAIRVGAKLAHFHHAQFIIGSATPSVSDYYFAQQKHVPIIRLSKPALSSYSKVRQIIVNKKDKLEFTRSDFLSTSLLEHINQQLTYKQQTLLFLNRRGSARVIACMQCGWRAVCSRCDLPLTLHEDYYELRCHTCGYSDNVISVCPKCNYNDIIFYGPGTKAVEREIARLFAGAKIMRFDSDNSTHQRIDKAFETINNGNIDIIIGTQILIKGFDFKRLGLVAIIDADNSLSFPDYTAEEKTYQIIHQAIGRVGRGHTKGTVIVQTIRPESSLIAQSLKGDWDSFYREQIASRQKHQFPPFSFLLKIETLRKHKQAAINAAQKLKTQLQTTYNNAVTILGPTASFKEKRSGSYSWQLVIKARHRSTLLSIIDNLPSGWKHDIDPIHLL